MGRSVGTHTDGKYDDTNFVEAISVGSVMAPPGYVYDSYNRDMLLDEPNAHIYGAYADKLIDDLVRKTEILKC